MDRDIIFNRMKHNAFFMVGLICAIIIIILVVVGPMLIKWNPTQVNLSDKFMAPEGFSRGLQGHILGTDQLGRDILIRMLIGGRYSLVIAVITVILQNLLGVVLGVVSGYFGGVVDSIIMRLCEVILAIPLLVLAIAVIAIVGPSVPNLIMVMTFGNWVYECKIIRNDVKIYKSKEFVKASKAFGGRNGHIMFRQIFPNITTNMLIVGSQSFGGILLMEASLSYLNLGIPIPAPAWGNMINLGRTYLTTYPWMAIAPGVALMLTVLSLNFLGDGLRDVLDPRENRGGRRRRRLTRRQLRLNTYDLPHG